MGNKRVYKKLAKAGTIAGILFFVGAFAICPGINADDQVDIDTFVEVKDKLNMLSDGINHAEFNLDAFERLAKENNYDLKGDLMFKQAKEEIKSAKINLKEGEEEFKEALSLLEGGKIEEAKGFLVAAKEYVEKGLEDVEGANLSLKDSLGSFADDKNLPTREEAWKKSIEHTKEEIKKAGNYIDGIEYVERFPFINLREAREGLDYSSNTLDKAKTVNPEYQLGYAYALLAETGANTAKDAASGIWNKFVIFCVVFALIPIAILLWIREEVREVIRDWFEDLFDKLRGYSIK